MKEPTKADLATAVAKLTEENAGLRELLAAVSEYARSVPLAVGDQRQELRRATETLIHIGVITDPCGAWVWGWGGGQGAARLREHAAKPVDYEVYVRPEDAEPASRRYCESIAPGTIRRCTEQGPHDRHRNGTVTWDAEPAKALVDAIAGNQNMTNKECIARVAHAGDEAAAVSA